MTLTKASIRQKVLDLGFDVMGITHGLPVSTAHAEHFDQWLLQGHAGSMGYMGRHRDKRLSPALLHGPTESIIIVGLNYKPKEDLPDVLPKGQGRVAHYAWYSDYHLFIKERLHELLAWIQSETQLPAKAKVCVDSAPVAERSLAQRAGLGFLGKNHMLIHPDLGPELFLGELFLPLLLDPDDAMEKDCGTCRRCLDACPTGALQDDGYFNASRCINTLTIEHKEDIQDELAKLLGDRVYGCDQCVKVCPYAKKAAAGAHPRFQIMETHRTLSLKAIMAMDQAAFDKEFVDTPIHRLGLPCLKRNAQHVMENE
jgi:epoxyqueuosine reductase